MPTKSLSVVERLKALKTNRKTVFSPRKPKWVGKYRKGLFYPASSRPELSTAMVDPGGFVWPAFTHIKVHGGGIVTYVRRVDMTQGMSPQLLKQLTLIHNTGWGNGYISIPAKHPFVSGIKQVIDTSNFLSQPMTFDVTYEYMNEHFPIPGNCWTWSSFGEIEVAEGDFVTFGFDTLHSWNSREKDTEESIVATIESFVNIINENI